MPPADVDALIDTGYPRKLDPFPDKLSPTTAASLLHFNLIWSIKFEIEWDFISHQQVTIKNRRNGIEIAHQIGTGILNSIGSP